MDLLQKLQAIQLELKAPKGQRNSFGNYNYRSSEDILEAIKPLSDKYGVLFKTSDEIKSVGDGKFVSQFINIGDDKYGKPIFDKQIIEEGILYVETTVRIIDVENSELQIESKGQAIIDFTAKGMQMPQRTGAASSYAKKYAYGNLLLIDDTKDSDATNNHDKDHKPTIKPELTGDKLNKAIASFKEGKVTLDAIRKAYSVSATNLKLFVK